MKNASFTFSTQFIPASGLHPWMARGHLLLAVFGVGFALAFTIISYTVDTPPFDYALLMRGAEIFCFCQDEFSFGVEWRTFYPAPFYTTFCLPYRHAEPLLRFIWTFGPVLIVLWMARGRGLALAYTPLGVLVLLGQSSWLLLPAFWLAAQTDPRRRAPWWHGLALLPCVFKPHIAFPVVLYLLYRWIRERSPALAVGVGAMIAVCIPAFLIRPNWLWEWLPNGRGFEPVNLASIAFVPVQILGLGFAPGAGAQAVVYGFCLLVGAGLLLFLYRWRGRLDFYDLVLVAFFINPFLNDYDLIVLMPFIVQTPRRLSTAAAGSVIGWMFAFLTRRFSMSFMATLLLVVLRSHETVVDGAPSQVRLPASSTTAQ